MIEAGFTLLTSAVSGMVEVVIVRLLGRCTVIKSQWVLPHLLARSVSRRCGIQVLGQKKRRKPVPCVTCLGM
jgi:hypothetical protein